MNTILVVIGTGMQEIKVSATLNVGQNDRTEDSARSHGQYSLYR